MGVLDILAQQWTTLSLPANYSKAILHEYSTVEQGELTILHTLGTDISKMFNFFMNLFFSRPVVVVIQPYAQKQNEIRAIGSP